MRRLAISKRTIKRTLTILVGAMVVVLVSFRVAAANRESLSRSLACPLSGKFVHGADVEMFVQEDGPANGRTVLFVHGTGAWSEIWRHTIDTLAASGFHVVAVDMPPFGFSERPATADYGDEAQGRRILAVVEALHLTGITLVGHSFGARPAMEAFFLDSSRFSRLVLVDAALGLSSDPPPPPGLLVRPADQQALAAALRGWLSDAELRARLRRAAAQRRPMLPRWSATVDCVVRVLAAVAA